MGVQKTGITVSMFKPTVNNAKKVSMSWPTVRQPLARAPIRVQSITSL